MMVDHFWTQFLTSQIFSLDDFSGLFRNIFIDNLASMTDRDQAQILQNVLTWYTTNNILYSVI